MSGVRPAGPDDATTMATVHAAAFDAPWSSDVLRAFLDSAGAFAAITEPSEAGFILCRRMAGEAEILTLAVEPSHRRGGLGSTLLSAAVDWAADAGAEALFLEVACDNAPAIALYATLNFNEVGRRRAYYSRPGGAMDALVLRRDLNR